MEEGRGMGRSGFANRAVKEAACEEVGVRARRFVGRLECGSEEVGMLSGMGSDIVEGAEGVDAGSDAKGFALIKEGRDSDGLRGVARKCF